MGPWEASSLDAFICRVSHALFPSFLGMVNGTDDEGVDFSPFSSACIGAVLLCRQNGQAADFCLRFSISHLTEHICAGIHTGAGPSLFPAYTCRTVAESCAGDTPDPAFQMPSRSCRVAAFHRGVGEV